MQKLQIRNWDRWQSYRRDRGQPPWIKVHREVMRNLDWVMMTDAQRGQLVAIWLLAADHDGVIPASPLAVQKLCHMSSEPDLQFFIDQGFIEGDAEVTPSRRQADAPEVEAEAETEAEKRQTNGAAAPSSSVAAGRFDDFWNAYPKKREKKKSREIWKRKRLSNQADEIIRDVQERQSRDSLWKQGYIPNPTTYLNGERWEDEFISANSQPSTDDVAAAAIAYRRSQEQ